MRLMYLMWEQVCIHKLQAANFSTSDCGSGRFGSRAGSGAIAYGSRSQVAWFPLQPGMSILTQCSTQSVTCVHPGQAASHCAGALLSSQFTPLNRSCGQSVRCPPPSSADGCFSPRRSCSRRHASTVRRIATQSRSAVGGGKEGGSSVAASDEGSSVLGPGATSHLDLLELYTGQSRQGTIAEQLVEKYENESSEDEETEASLLLSRPEKLEPPPLTIHQKRNIRRQNYLNEVAKRNDAPFFSALFFLVLLPPICILAVAVATGYVKLP